MKDIALYEQLLGLKAPWHVDGVDLRLEDAEVIVHVGVDEELWGCPECGRRMHLHDRETRRWRHLDTCQFKTIIEASVPRVKCPEHGTKTVRVPWAEPHCRFTAMFERLAIDMLLHCSASAVSRHMRLSWDEVDHIKERAVLRGLHRKEPVPARALCIDEKSVGRMHDYVTVVTKITETGPVIDFIADGRDEAALDDYWAGHTAEARAKIGCVSMDMWQAYINSVEKWHPRGKYAISHDPFHIIQHMNKAVDDVRRQEQALFSPEEAKTLKGTRFMWLYGFENLPDKWVERMKALKNSQMKTALAWRIKEQLRAMYQCQNLAQARDFFADWYKSAMGCALEPIRRVARMLRRHMDQVLSYFIHRITNAYSEGMNSAIQGLVKRANGYRNRTRLKRDLMFHLGGLNLYPAVAQ